MLTPAQIEARRGKLTASRVAVLMKGVPGDIMDLYLEMIGEKAEKDLSRYWPAYHGSHTEAHHLEWLQDVTLSQPITRRGEVVIHPRHDWAASTLDGWLDHRPCAIEVKNTGCRESFDTVAQRYMPQMHWQMMCTNTTECAFSVIQGANEPQCEFIQMDFGYGWELLDRAGQFMEFVRRRHPPVVLPAVQPPVIPTRIIDMTGNNMWGSYAREWLETKEAAKTAEFASKTLKSLVPADAKMAHGNGIQISVNKAGSKTIKEVA